MSWESSAQYYAIINRAVRERLGGSHSAETLLYSVDFGEIERLQHDGDWSSLTARMVDAARRLEAGGVENVLFAAPGASIAGLRTFAEEIMPAFDRSPLRLAQV